VLEDVLIKRGLGGRSGLLLATASHVMHRRPVPDTNSMTGYLLRPGQDQGAVAEALRALEQAITASSMAVVSYWCMCPDGPPGRLYLCSIRNKSAVCLPVRLRAVDRSVLLIIYITTWLPIAPRGTHCRR